jgi:hypothetical protein
MSPELAPVGEYENPDEINFDTVTIPIVGYRVTGSGKTEKREPVTTKIEFTGNVPPGTVRDLVKSVGVNGKILVTAALKYLDDCVTDESREAWEILIHDPDIKIVGDTIGEAYRALASYYTDRPFMKPSGSRNGRKPTGQTSKRVAKSQASKRQPSPRVNG